MSNKLQLYSDSQLIVNVLSHNKFNLTDTKRVLDNISSSLNVYGLILNYSDYQNCNLNNVCRIIVIGGNQYIVEIR